MKFQPENEDAATLRMSPQVEDKTRRMESRVGGIDARDQSEIATHHIATEGVTSGASPARSGPLGGLAPGVVLCGDCLVQRTHHNHESARPGLFECQAPEGHVMVKVAASDYPPQPNLWSKLPLLNHPNVLRIHRAVEADSRFYEVQEFCTGGTLADFVPYAGSSRMTPSADWVEKTLVAAFHAGISYLHSQDIVHRDIKPSNLYVRETNGRKTLVIGDFDISSVLQTGRTSRSTERVAGTWVYSAPEAFPRFVDDGAAKLGSAVVRSSDYYSFGVVIVELLLGTTSLHQAQLPDLYDFYLQGGRVEIPVGMSPRLSELLSGLLCRNRNRRWGSEEVGRWLQGQTTEEDRKRIAEDRGYQLGRSVVSFNAFEKAKPTSLSELEQAIVQEPKIGLEELMAGDVMLNWIGQLDSRVARQIRQDRDKWRAHPRIALLCARLHLNPSAPFPVDANNSVSNITEWAKKAQVAVARDTASAARLCAAERLLELEVWLRLKQSPDPQSADRVGQIAANHSTTDPKSSSKFQTSDPQNPALVLEELSYAFLPQKPYLVAPGTAAQTPSQIARLSLGDAKDWIDKPPPVYLASFKRWQEGFLEAYLRQRLTAEPESTSPLLLQIKKVRLDLAEKPFLAFEVTLHLLDPTLSPLQIEFDPSPFHEVFQTPYGSTAHISIGYRALGVGMPHAAIQLNSPWDALQLETHEITYRRGQIKLNLHSLSDMPVSKEFAATFTLEGRTTQLLGDSPVLKYQVTYPRSVTFKRVFNGAFFGAAILGGARLCLMTVVPHALRVEHAGITNSGAWVVILPVTSAAFYGAFRLWIWALTKLAR